MLANRIFLDFPEVFLTLTFDLQSQKFSELKLPKTGTQKKNKTGWFVLNGGF